MNEQLYFSFHDSVFGFSLDKVFGDLEEFEFEQILPRINQLEEKGYRFLQSWSIGFRCPDRLIFPDGRIMDLNELIKYEENSKLNLAKSREAKEALEYFGLVDSPQYADERWGLDSFLNEEDEQIARKKYNPKLAA